jgi:hypothetical protein
MDKPLYRNNSCGDLSVKIDEITVCAPPPSNMQVVAVKPHTPMLQQVKMSSMEEENMRERIRLSLLKECTARLTADNIPRFNKDVFRRAMQEKVRNFKYYRFTFLIYFSCINFRA